MSSTKSKTASTKSKSTKPNLSPEKIAELDEAIAYGKKVRVMLANKQFEYSDEQLQRIANLNVNDITIRFEKLREDAAMKEFISEEVERQVAEKIKQVEARFEQRLKEIGLYDMHQLSTDLDDKLEDYKQRSLANSYC